MTWLSFEKKWATRNYLNFVHENNVDNTFLNYFWKVFKTQQVGKIVTGNFWKQHQADVFVSLEPALLSKERAKSIPLQREYH